jgi:hypothetical protein
MAESFLGDRMFIRKAARTCFQMFVGVLVLCAGTANAVPVTWTLSGVTFTDGGTATGSFVYDADTDDLSTWSVSVAGGDTQTFPPITYDSTDSSATYLTNAPTTFGALFSLNSSFRGIRLPATSVLSNAGGTLPVNIGSAAAAECYNCNPFRNFTAGNLVGAVAPAITSSAVASYQVGATVNFTITSTGAPTPALTIAGTLPSGVTFTDNGDSTATLAGTATPPGVYNVVITASNGVNPNAIQNFTLTVVGTAPVITSGASVSYHAGATVNFTVTSTGSPTSTLTVTGALPSGVTFTDNGDGTGNFAGKATPPGVYNVSISASNGVNPDAIQSFALTVQAPAPVLPTPALGRISLIVFTLLLLAMAWGQLSKHVKMRDE